MSDPIARRKRRRNPVDISGKRFGRLSVIGLSHIQREARWACRCDCGNVVSVRGYSLRAGKTRSCGCLSREITSARKLSHGESHKTAEYQCWMEIHRRCNSPSNQAYAHYGGRGISVCERWSEFHDFLADMGRRPSPKHSIDRHPDNNGNYEPGNCRWATATEQNRNNRHNRIIEYNGEKKSMAEWAEQMGLKVLIDLTYTLVWRVVPQEFPQQGQSGGGAGTYNRLFTASFGSLFAK